MKEFLSCILMMLAATCYAAVELQPQELDKAKSAEIIANARNGMRQQIIVEFDADIIVKDVATRRLKLEKDFDKRRSGPTSGLQVNDFDAELLAQDSLLLGELQHRLGEVKRQVIEETQGAGKIVKDYD